VDARTIAGLRSRRPGRMTFRLAALDREHLRARVAVGVHCPGCGLLYLADPPPGFAPAALHRVEAEARAMLSVACPDHACAYTVDGRTTPP
jgi:hypothetical protein